MSHFSVIVVTPEKPTAESLAAVLQPFHEYECTGKDDQYVVDVNVTSKLEEHWAQSASVVRFPDGRIANKYSDQFYTKPGTPDFLGKPKMEFELPAGCELAEVPQSALSAAEGQTKEEFAEEYGGWKLRDGRFWDRTNPNAKWDWWQVGGRYSGKFAPGYDPETDPNHRERCWLCLGTGKRLDMVCQNGCNGCAGTGTKTKWPTEWKNTPGNQIRVGDIPWSRLRAAAVQDALKEFDKAAALTKGMAFPDPAWGVICKLEGPAFIAARDAFNEAPMVKALREWWGVVEIIQTLGLSRDEVAMRAARRPLTFWAFLKDGQWVESGKMGWFGLSNDDADPDEWQAAVNKMLEELPANYWLTVVDCHI